MSDLKTNLTPYPELHYFIPNMTPILPGGNEEKNSFNLLTLVRNLYRDDTLMVAAPSVIEENLKTTRHKFIASALLFRGDFDPKVSKLYHG